MADAVVKIDSGLMKKVEDFIKKNKFKYSSKKQFVDIAVYEMLEKVRKR